MKKQTALQLLIEQWNKELQNPLGVLEDYRSYHAEDINRATRKVREINKRIDQATELLETEREIIEEAHFEGGYNTNGSRHEAARYYKDTYQ